MLSLVGFVVQVDKWLVVGLWLYPENSAPGDKNRIEQKPREGISSLLVRGLLLALHVTERFGNSIQVPDLMTCRLEGCETTLQFAHAQPGTLLR